MHLDLNADLGEEITDDAALLGVVSSANVACGYHAGSVAIMREVCARAVTSGVSVGAQVSYADRENFGRLDRDVPASVLREQVADQVGTLAAIAAAEGTSVRYVKPHGALYHRVIDDEVQATAVLDGSGELPVLAMVPGALAHLASERGRTVWSEAFPDRGYTDQGRLVPRGEPGALVEGEAAIASRAVELAARPDIHSLCLHGDSPGAVAAARAVRSALRGAGWQLRGL
ncbi:LamB/YcsF family protein [Nocardioides jishulii]|uniref:LamB/YcsF family protein n=1 Tax=Nocardioides jishulii TaxID=2575440 RepID=A0A4U2YM91_9ACTN|nr:LamB/YcsF family protein [Nocardioides jishulii]QCX27229.1 LamB/YcsF family protein [Nocardioides jishulii]TKI61715.1 LamB/YcsF family protein [Nocardioides jishulii]